MSLVTITLVSLENEEKSLSGVVGQSVMELAVAASLDGIEAQCGGACSCATCHIIVDRAWIERLPPASAIEIDMLEFSSVERTPESRLSCQIKLSPELEGFRATIAGG